MSNICRILRRFKREVQGTSAVEFALIFPVMLIVYFGLVEITNGLEAKRKVEIAANLTGMLVAQAEEVDDDYMANIFEATEMAFDPLDTTPLKVVVSSVIRVYEDGEWVNKVDWSAAYGIGAEALEEDSVLDPPEDDILDDNGSLIVTEVEYTYSKLLPNISYVDYFAETIVFTKTFWSHPRYVSAIPFDDGN